MRKMTSIRLDTDILAKLARLVEKTGQTKTGLIERGILLVMKQLDDKGANRRRRQPESRA